MMIRYLGVCLALMGATCSLHAQLVRSVTQQFESHGFTWSGHMACYFGLPDPALGEWVGTTLNVESQATMKINAPSWFDHSLSMWPFLSVGMNWREKPYPSVNLTAMDLTTTGIGPGEYVTTGSDSQDLPYMDLMIQQALEEGTDDIHLLVEWSGFQSWHVRNRSYSQAPIGEVIAWFTTEGDVEMELTYHYVIPEPSSYAAIAVAALTGIAWWRRRRR